MIAPLRVCLVSGGKDSTALYLWMLQEFGPDGFIAVFNDTGHEHPVTLNYLRELPSMAQGPEVITLRSDFAERLSRKGIDPSGNTFLDMMLWKGRAPSSQARFCTEFTKLEPTKLWLEKRHAEREVILYQGVRAQESAARALLPEVEHSKYFDCEIRRPLLHWTTDRVFAYLEAFEVPPNPLYEAGFGRVGCFPCIMATKGELARLPDWAWEKLEAWEKRIGKTWFSYGDIPLTQAQQWELAAIPAVLVNCAADGEPPVLVWGPEPIAFAKFKDRNSPTVAEAREWAKTARGGRQMDMFAPDAKDVPSCMSTWGACE